MSSVALRSQRLDFFQFDATASLLFPPSLRNAFTIIPHTARTLPIHLNQPPFPHSYRAKFYPFATEIISRPRSIYPAADTSILTMPCSLRHSSPAHSKIVSPSPLLNPQRVGNPSNSTLSNPTTKRKTSNGVTQCPVKVQSSQTKQWDRRRLNDVVPSIKSPPCSLSLRLEERRILENRCSIPSSTNCNNRPRCTKLINPSLLLLPFLLLISSSNPSSIPSLRLLSPLHNQSTPRGRNDVNRV